jgi:hypothetical protein
MAEIRGITLIRPWGYAIAHCGKDVENRPWECSLPVGSWIAIHNGKKWDESAVEYIRQRVPHVPIPTKEVDLPGQIIAISRFCGNVNESDSPWFMGPVGVCFDRIIAIDPIPHAKGQLGLWRLPEETLEKLRKAYSAYIRTW